MYLHSPNFFGYSLLNGSWSLSSFGVMSQHSPFHLRKVWKLFPRRVFSVLEPGDDFGTEIHSSLVYIFLGIGRKIREYRTLTVGNSFGFTFSRPFIDPTTSEMSIRKTFVSCYLSSRWLSRCPHGTFTSRLSESITKVREGRRVTI